MLVSAYVNETQLPAKSIRYLVEASLDFIWFTEPVELSMKSHS